MLSVLNTYDWKEAFSFANNINPVPGAKCSNSAFTIENVVWVLSKDEGYSDGPDWLCCGLLEDGRWFMLSAWCDFTGWDCKAGGYANVADTRDDLLRLGINEGDLARLKLVRPGEV